MFFVGVNVCACHTVVPGVSRLSHHPFLFVAIVLVVSDREISFFETKMRGSCSLYEIICIQTVPLGCFPGTLGTGEQK